MSTPVFPALAGQGWSVHKSPNFSTLIADHVSGREVRAQLWQNPRWDFELVFNALDGTTTGQYGGLGASSLQTLMGFFLQAGGSAQNFLLYDATDYTVTNQAFGSGDGTTTAFQLLRTIGGFSESIFSPVTTTTTLYFPGGATASAVAPVIKKAGSVVSPSAYSISNGLVTFTTAPASGAALQWTGFYGFLCRFADDKLDFEQFMANLWKADSVKLKSVRPY